MYFTALYSRLLKQKNIAMLLVVLTICSIISFLLFANVQGASVKAAASPASPAQGRVFTSSTKVPLLQFPEGITNWHGKIYVGAYNVVTPTDSRIFVYNEKGTLLCQLGGQPGQELISSGQLLGLTINRETGDLFANANGTGNVLRIHNPGCEHATVSIYATYPGTGGGPEDMAFNKQGTLYDSDSNRGLVYAIPPGGGVAKLIIGPPSSGAPIDDKGLLQAPIAGLTPNGVVFSLDDRTLYIANTYADSVVAFDVNAQGKVTGNARIFAQHLNPDLEEYPTGFDALVQPDTKIGPSASTPLNGPDGLALDSKGRVWVASNLGDNITVLDHQGNVVKTYGTSEVTAHGLLNQPASLTFVGDSVYTTNLSIFTGLAGKPNLPFTVVRFDVGVTGAGGNGNY